MFRGRPVPERRRHAAQPSRRLHRSPWCGWGFEAFLLAVSGLRRDGGAAESEQRARGFASLERMPGVGEGESNPKLDRTVAADSNPRDFRPNASASASASRNVRLVRSSSSLTSADSFWNTGW